MNIVYRMPDEKITALAFAELLKDSLAKEILENGYVESREEATHLSRFFKKMATQTAQGGSSPPCELGTEFWIERLRDSIGRYLKEAGYAEEWNKEMNKIDLR